MASERKPSLKAQFIDAIQHQILSGELEIGSQLPTERELAEQMGVSRQVVNSGIDELQRRGFIRVVPRHGTYVEDFRLNGDMNTLNAIMAFQGDDLHEREIRSILEVRWGIEHLTLKDAIDNASDADIEALGGIVESLGQSRTPEEAAEWAYCYQHTMALIGGNTVLPLIISSFKPSTSRLWIRFIRHYGVGALYENTATAYRYVRARDLDGAIAWLTLVLHEVISGDRQIYTAAPGA